MNFLRAISNLLRFDRTNWKVLALCFVAAAIFWMFNALNKTYATNVRLPLKFEFDDAAYIAVEPLPGQLVLNVSGNGWDIFRKGFGLKVPDLSIPLDRPAETRKIIATGLAPLVASQLGTLQLNFIVTDTLRLKIESKVIRRIRLRAELKEISFKSNFGRTSPVVLLPDSVTLEGPKSIIESLPDTLSVHVAASRLNKNFRENVEIIVPNNELINRNPPVAEVMFDVGPVVEITRNIPILLPRLPWGLEVSPDSVQCVFIVSKISTDRFLVEASRISASITIPDLAKGQLQHVLPTLRNVPIYVETLWIDSIRVKKY